MIAALLGFGCGTAIGVLGTLLVLGWRRLRRVVTIPPETVVILDEHAATRQAQVAAFADGLADGDSELRARLRRFERGGAR